MNAVTTYTWADPETDPTRIDWAARQAAWVRADSCRALVAHLAASYGGRLFAAHRDLLAELLG